MRAVYVMRSRFLLVVTSKDNYRSVGCLVRHTCTTKGNRRCVQLLRSSVLTITRIIYNSCLVKMYACFTIFFRFKECCASSVSPIFFSYFNRTFRRSRINAAVSGYLTIFPRPFTGLVNNVRMCQISTTKYKARGSCLLRGNC